MQLRALIKTRKRKWAMIVLGVVVCAAAVWLLLDVGHKPTDEEKYWSMVHNHDRMTRLANLVEGHKLPTPLVTVLLRHNERLFDRTEKLYGELWNDGYLVGFLATNVDIDVRMHEYQLGGCRCWEFHRYGDETLIICRTNDVAGIRAALEKKP